MKMKLTHHVTLFMREMIEGVESTDEPKSRFENFLSLNVYGHVFVKKLRSHFMDLDFSISSLSLSLTNKVLSSFLDMLSSI